MAKTCCRCGQTKPETDFYSSKGWRDGYHPYCRACLLAYQREARLKKLDATDPDRQRWSRDFQRTEYFSEPTKPIQAYIIGLLAADGHVLESRPLLSLELAVKDEELVRLVRDELVPGFPYRYRKGKKPRIGSPTAMLQITSRQMVDDLASFGVVPRKSLIMTWPMTLGRDLWRPYLLGYFDGDGYVTICQIVRGKPYPRWGLCGTRDFLISARDLINEETGVTMRRPHQANTIWKMETNGSGAWTIDEWIHQDGLGLERKRIASIVDPRWR
jgi:hypothetical protein